MSLFGSSNKKFGYNLTSGGQTGNTFTEESRRKMSLAQTGKKISPESLRKQFETKRRLGKLVMPETTRRAIRASRLGKAPLLGIYRRPDVSIPEVAALYKSGVPALSIAKRYNISTVSIYKRLKIAGVERCLGKERSLLNLRSWARQQVQH